jgi:23S rRNA (adenine2030-N6)-methyltransferase
MNYRHHFHAANFADVVKHVVLVQLLRALQKKEKGLLYLDTHAGRGAYDLRKEELGDSLSREPEWPNGLGRLLARSDLPAAVTDYVDLVHVFDRSRGNLDEAVRFYPGSPWITRLLARPQDRLVLCELHRAEVDALRRELAGAESAAGPRVVVQEIDGYVAVKAQLPPPERRAVVLIDPPYEAQDEFAQVTNALAEGLRRFPGGVFALWYPLTERARIDEFFAAILRLAPPPTLLVELAIAGETSSRKLKGCGMLIVNPPWQFDRQIEPALDFLAHVLALEPGAVSQLSWLVPEK